MSQEPKDPGAEPTGFERPSGWGSLGGAAETPPVSDGGVPVTPAAVPPPPWDNLGQQRFPAPPGSPVAPPGVGPALSGYPTYPTTATTARRVTAVGCLSVIGVVMALIVAAAVVSRLNPTRSTPTTSYSPDMRVTKPLASRWEVKPASLGAAQFIAALDGQMNDSFAIDAATTWVVLTGDESEHGIVARGLDAETGQQRWQRPMEDGLCATALLDDAVVCAGAVARDPATGLGITWRVAVLDPVTGDERRATEIQGWLTLINVAHGEITLVEQRLPAPHAVVRQLGSDLTERWQVDLSGEAGHDKLFSTDRIYMRTTRLPKGPALDRPRIRIVGGGLIALWSGDGTAFIDPKTGTLLALPYCSRLVDDGERLWCNAGDHAVAYSYQLKALYQTAPGIRLLFPYQDELRDNVTDPVFTQSDDGVTMKVDLTTGETQGALAPTKNGSAFGAVTSPYGLYLGDSVTLLADDKGTYAMNVRTGEVRWYVKGLTTFGDGLTRNGEFLITGSGIRVVNPATGETRANYDPAGMYVQSMKVALAGGDDRVIARLVDP